MNKGDGNKGGGQATAMRAMAMTTSMATTWAMATAMRLAGDEDRKCCCNISGHLSTGNGLVLEIDLVIKD